MDKVLVTGSAGYVGSVLCRALLREGFHVIATDNFYKGAPNSLVELCEFPDFEFHYGDVGDVDFMHDIVSKADVIIALAGLVGFPICRKNPREAWITNYEGMVNLASLSSPQQRILFPSTNSVYASVKGVCTEESETSPTTIYGKTKLCAENALLSTGKDNAVIFRFATLFGASPQFRTDLLPHDFACRGLRDGVLNVFEGDAVRAFLHLDDAVQLYLLAAKGAVKPDVYNACNPVLHMTKREIAEKVAAVTGCRVIESDYASDPELRDYRMDCSKLGLTGFKSYRGMDMTTIVNCCKLLKDGE
jgi:nucleoside-diphosphate-sugar epimerase